MSMSSAASVSSSAASVSSSSASVSSSVASSESDSTGSERTEYSLEDCPALTKLDWDAFNEAFRKGNIEYIPDVFEWIGEDPRVDWEEVNECFDEYYGGSDSAWEFFVDVFDTHMGGRDERTCWLTTLAIEPFYTRDCTHEYDDLRVSVYADITAEKRNEIELAKEIAFPGYNSYSEMLIYEGMEKYGDDLDALAKYQASMIENYLSASEEPTLIEGTSVEIVLKYEYRTAYMVIDTNVFQSKPFINASGEPDYNLKDYVYFFDLVQGYLGDGVDYASLVGRYIDAIREYADAQ